jgi:hypothetical protein
LRSAIQTKIYEYADTYLGKFDTVFRFSQLSRIIDAADYSISNNLMSIKTYKSIIPIVGLVNDINVQFANRITPGTILSTEFSLSTIPFNVHLEDDGFGKIVVIFVDEANIKRTHITYAGTVNYTTGEVKVEKITVMDYVGDLIKVYAQPTINDVFSNNNNVVRLQNTNVVVNTFTTDMENL